MVCVLLCGFNVGVIVFVLILVLCLFNLYVVNGCCVVFVGFLCEVLFDVFLVLFDNVVVVCQCLLVLLEGSCVFVVGGDGIVYQLLFVFVECCLQLGLLFGGIGNDFVCVFGFVYLFWCDVLVYVCQVLVLVMDFGEIMMFEGGVQFFMFSFIVGFDVVIVLCVYMVLKWLCGQLCYFWVMLIEIGWLCVYVLCVEVDGVVLYYGLLLFVFSLNMFSYGSGMLVVFGVCVDDGELQLLCVGVFGWFGVLVMMLLLLIGLYLCYCWVVLSSFKILWLISFMFLLLVVDGEFLFVVSDVVVCVWLVVFGVVWLV